jgi:hypothetical protein
MSREKKRLLQFGHITNLRILDASSNGVNYKDA